MLYQLTNPHNGFGRSATQSIGLARSAVRRMSFRGNPGKANFVQSSGKKV
jgi:hypothetical protein